MKMVTLYANLAAALKMEMSEFTELDRALKEQSSAFDAPDSRIPTDILRGKPGPGGGLEADPFRAAFFLVALTIGGPRKEAALNVWSAWHLNHAGSVLAGYGPNFKPMFTACELTGCHLFGEALRRALTDESLAARIDHIRIAGNSTAEIHFDRDRSSTFGLDLPDFAASQGLYRIAVLDGLILHGVAQMLKRS